MVLCFDVMVVLAHVVVLHAMMKKKKATVNRTIMGL